MDEKEFDFYICHSISIKKIARNLALDLIKIGANTWIDFLYIGPEDDWKKVTQDALQKTHCVLVMIGPDGISPRGQSEELKMILSLPDVRIIPVLLRDVTTEKIPSELAGYLPIFELGGIPSEFIFAAFIKQIKYGLPDPSQGGEILAYVPRLQNKAIGIDLLSAPDNKAGIIKFLYSGKLLNVRKDIGDYWEVTCFDYSLSVGFVRKNDILIEQPSIPSTDPAPLPPPPLRFQRLSSHRQGGGSGGDFRRSAKPLTPSTRTAKTSSIITINPGDTLGKIAKKHGVTISEIIKHNNIHNLGQISVNEKLQIPEKNVFAEALPDIQEATPPPPAEEMPSKEPRETTTKSKTEGKKGGGSIHIVGNQDTVKYKRVLNSSFVGSRGIVLPDQALARDKDYTLLIDIGPLWQIIPSIVVKSEKTAFPEKHLPAIKDGYIVRVVFVSEDFTPHLNSAEMWIPVKNGQSFPILNGKRASAPGPVELLVRAPELKIPNVPQRAYGRLCLYYRGELIQSAIVSVGIDHEEGLHLIEPHKIEVDYVLTKDLTDFKEHLGNRRVQFGVRESRPVSVNLALNDDGSGRHRILATYHLNSIEEATVPPAWTPYDAQSAEKTLVEFRKVVAECYEGIDQNFGKPRKQFGKDMLKLAKLGDRLRTLALGDMDVSGTGKTVALWRRELLVALKTATVIQIARTGPANYVFPWALVYEYPMPGPDYKLCKVIEEWNDDGIRGKDVEMACPYQDEDWHQENIICPYGFWGLKHIIEQPTGAIHKQDNHWTFDVCDKIFTKKDVGFGVGVTDDIDQVARDQHLGRLVKNMKVHLDPLQPAHNRKTALEMLRAPEIVYFLCHGEVDAGQTPYLSIGEHINNSDYEIFPNTLEQWSLLTRGGLDLSAWQSKRPLVFINGCHTAQLQPGIVLNFVSAFADLGASGVIGTEVSVLADMAMVISEAILGRIGDGMEVGQAVREMRWEMLNRGNLLGLAYTPYSLANLHIERTL